MKRLPIGIQSFGKIIEGDYVYADKTQYIFDLINSASYYFLSRPRRFGKSLLLDTIGEVFKGNRELFKGLWIYDSDYGFEKHPVIRLDMSSISNENPEILKTSFASELRKQLRDEGLDLTDEVPSDMFKNLIEGLYKKYGQKVVVLIDEYDKPIIDHIHDVPAAEANRLIVRGFYGVLKSMDPYLRFTFLTGVTKFAKTSVFSELNNLKDITMTEKYANICGIPVEDFDKLFSEHIESLKVLKAFKNYENLRGRILEWYDGYSWDGESRVINPFSLLSFFGQERIGAYWYASGSPKFLIDLIKENPGEYTNLKSLRINESMLDAADFNKLEATPLLFQTGYLSVKEVIETGATPMYELEIPNREVGEAFNTHIIAEFTESGHMGANNMRFDMDDALRDGDTSKMLETLRGLFASIPFNLHIDKEAYYHSIFYAIMNVLGFKIDAEAATSKGRIDAALETDDKVYVFEFKFVSCPPDASSDEKRKLFDKSLKEGMDQINSRGYHKKYSGSGKTIFKAAFAFLGRDDIEMASEVESPGGVV